MSSRSQLLRAGDLSCLYENGSLRHIRAGTREVLLRIYFAVRDQNWGTIPISITRETLASDERSFRIDFDAEHQQCSIRFGWHGVITGSEQNAITFSAEGEPKTEFLRNRIGLCVLHPIETCAGQRCRVEHTDGSTEESRFPDLISPHQPFLDLRAISYEPIAGVLAETRFSGDAFETEDQRNWTDASFKTYSTPLSTPFPVRVGRGNRVRQRVELLVNGNAPVVDPPPSQLTEIEVDSQRVNTLPSIGWSWDGTKRSLSHVRVDVRSSEQSWREALRAAGNTGIPVELAVFVRKTEDLHTLQNVLAQVNVNALRLLVFQEEHKFSNPQSLAAARELFPGIPIGGGSSKDFAELNRNRAIAEGCDVLAWAVDPQVHAVDDATTIENLAGQQHTIATARSFAPRIRFCLSPVSIPRFANEDGWAVISLKNLTQAGASSITFSRSLPVLEEIQRFGAGCAISAFSSNPLAADALVLRNGGAARAWVVNFLADEQQVMFGGKKIRLEPFSVRALDVEL